MKATIQIAAALLLVGGSAQAQSDHIGSNWQYPSTKTEIRGKTPSKPANTGQIILLRKKSPVTPQPIKEGGRTLWGK